MTMERDMTDQSLHNLIGNAVAATLTPEFVEKEVKARVEKLITESINHALRSYSDTGKLIQKAVEDALKVDRLDLPSYGMMVTDMLRAQIEATVHQILAGRLADDMAELLKMAPKEARLSEITEEMVKGRRENGDYGPNLITCIVEDTDYGYQHIYLDPSNHYTAREKYHCEYRFGIDKDGRIFSAKLSGVEYKTGKPNTSAIGRAYGWDQKFRAMVACNTTLIVDEQNVRTGWED